MGVGSKTAQQSSSSEPIAMSQADHREYCGYCNCMPDDGKRKCYWYLLSVLAFTMVSVGFQWYGESKSLDQRYEMCNELGAQVSYDFKNKWCPEKITSFWTSYLFLCIAYWGLLLFVPFVVQFNKAKWCCGLFQAREPEDSASDE